MRKFLLIFLGTAAVFAAGRFALQAPEQTARGSARTAAADTPAVQGAPQLPNPSGGTPSNRRSPFRAIVAPNTSFTVTPITAAGALNSPWAMTFLPDGRLLVTLKGGSLRVLNPANLQNGAVTGVPTVVNAGQGGLGDVVLHPNFAQNNLIYLSYAEAGTGGQAAAVARATLTLDGAGGGALSNLTVIWRQSQRSTGQGHYSYRMAFDRKGKLFISSGDRQLGSPAQSMTTNLGKIIRLNDDGSIPADNPFASQGGVAAQVWTLGHRSILGLAFDAKGRLWEHEHGPEGGDELNLLERGTNYGWPNVCNGSNYGGGEIPDHNPAVDGYNAPEAWWTPVIAPAGFVIYDGAMFPWARGDGFIGGLASQSLVRIRFDGKQAREIQRYAMGARIREVEQGPDGALWLLEDGTSGRLLRLTRP